MKKEKLGKINSDLLIWLLAFVPVLFYRIILIVDYVSKYVEDDQLTMWYTTAMYGHFQGFEPHFIGQNYGSSLEAIVAVPLYWLHVPLWYAVPIATLVLFILPFAMCSFVLLRKRKVVESLIVILLIFANNWKFDLLTAVSRGFISGFAFVFAGVLLINACARVRYQVLLGTILMVLGYINTESCLTVISLGILYYILFHDNKKRDIKEFVLGGIIGIVLLVFCNYTFYKINPEALVYYIDIHGVSLDVFKENVARIGQLFSTFSFVNFMNIPVLLLLIILGTLVIIIKKRSYKMLLFWCCLIVGSISMLSVKRMIIYGDEFSYCQERMLLFVAFVLLWGVFALFNEGIISISIPESNWMHKNMNVLVVGALLIVSIFKVVIFKLDVVDREELHSVSYLPIYDVSSIVANATVLSELTRENNIELVLFTDGLGMSYGTMALNYQQYRSYYYFLDRRSDVYMYIRDNIYTGNVLCVDYDSMYLNDAVMLSFNNVDIIKWMTENGIRPSVKWRVIERLDNNVCDFIVEEVEQ